MTEIEVQGSQEELLAAYRQWLLRIAWEYATGPEQARDLAQEGWIAMWRASQTVTPPCVSQKTYLLNSARYRMKRCVSRQTWLGMPDRRVTGYGGTARRAWAKDVEVAHGGIADLGELDMSATVYEDVEYAYHHGEIMAALNELSPAQRERVLRTFWLDERMPTGGWWYGPGGVRDRLAGRLSHLRVLVASEVAA
jgi:RNA polymerase sigma factor (sigma-70 family)